MKDTEGSGECSAHGKGKGKHVVSVLKGVLGE
jgi:hypothetical protein